MPRPQHEFNERHYERLPHEEILERLERIEDVVRRIEDKLR